MKFITIFLLAVISLSCTTHGDILDKIEYDKESNEMKIALSKKIRYEYYSITDISQNLVVAENYRSGKNYSKSKDILIMLNDSELFSNKEYLLTISTFGHIFYEWKIFIDSNYNNVESIFMNK